MFYIVSIIKVTLAGYHWFILDLVDLLQSIITCVTAYYIIKYLNKKEELSLVVRSKEEETAIANTNEDFLLNSLVNDA